MTWISRLSSAIPILLLTIVSLACILPLILVISISFSDIDSIYKHGYTLFPKEFSWEAYTYILSDTRVIMNAYGVSIFITIVGTLFSLAVLCLIAYPLSRREFKFQRPVMFYVFFTMLFNGGLVPWYIVISNYYHLKDTLWVLILPYAVIPWFLILLRTFFAAIPTEIIEAARVEGCSEFRLLLQIILPISKPALATVGLLAVLRYWNDWWLSLLFIDNRNLYPLQLLMHKIMSNIQELARSAGQLGILEVVNFPSESARMAMAIIAAGPMLFIFLFFQKYFIKGLTVGALKG
jgi:putative aldouronate transport system permease protein